MEWRPHQFHFRKRKESERRDGRIPRLSKLVNCRRAPDRRQISVFFKRSCKDLLHSPHIGPEGMLYEEERIRKGKSENGKRSEARNVKKP